MEYNTEVKGIKFLSLSFPLWIDFKYTGEWKTIMQNDTYSMMTFDLIKTPEII